MIGGIGMACGFVADATLSLNKGGMRIMKWLCYFFGVLYMGASFMMSFGYATPVDWSSEFAFLVRQVERIGGLLLIGMGYMISRIERGVSPEE